MGEHATWWDYLNNIPAWRDVYGSAQEHLGRTWQGAMFGETEFSLAHVLSAALVSLFLIFGAFAYKGALVRAGKDAIVPPSRFTLRNLFEMFCDGVMSIMEGVMGKKIAPKYLPLIGSLAFFIFFNNTLALIPGFAPATATLKTNLGLGVLVFLATHYYGVKEGGLAYFKHFLGPLLWLAPLMLPIEIISHLARPLSLSMRLMGNMAADHKVVAAFFGLVPILVPVPFLVLGMMVVVIQTLVFCLLSMVYISMAVAHNDHDHGGEHHDEHAAAH
jgi:F-type H+-transporting ATPase subunit a